MPLLITNTLTRKKEVFTPQTPGVVKMYNCGPTVYSYPHIGNFRSFLFADVLRRYLEYQGLRVDQVMNITDVGHLQADADEGEDRMEIAAKREHKDPWQIAHRYAVIFLELVKALNMRPALRNPLATDHVPEMIALIGKLIEKKHAYVVDGEVFYDISSFPSYGRLSGNTTEQLMAGARVEKNPKKRNPLDFALWKTDAKHIMQWDSPWGRGFPGWHIECNAMSMKYLGDTLDIHTGGEDNIFPHHECEIAQGEGITGKPFVRYWMHARHLLVGGQRMAKSLGNFLTVADVLDKGYSPRVLRFALINAQYRQPIDFSFERLDAARVTVERLLDFKRRLKTFTQDKACFTIDGILAPARAEFEAGMDDDLNISAALAGVHNFMAAVNRVGPDLGAPGAARALELLDRFDSVLGVLHDETPAGLSSDEQALVDARAAARTRRDFKESDRLRNELKARGILVEDTAEGQRWKRN